MSRPRFFVPDARPGAAAIALPAEEAHHLRHVLRLTVGADVAVFDGRGREWDARVTGVGPSDAVTVELVGEIPPATEPTVRVTLGIGILKGDQMNAVVRDATMLGVATVAPFVSAYVSVPSRVWKGDAVRARWRRIAIASAKQCRRAIVPEIAVATPFADLVRAPFDERLICVEPSSSDATTAFRLPPRPATALVLIGPEGGWAPEELEVARQSGATRLRCGPRTLRAETAPMVVLSALWTVWGW
jgi:16S rRNA (uracil1498-N3)-methyltransferase